MATIDAKSHGLINVSSCLACEYDKIIYLQGNGMSFS